MVGFSLIEIEKKITSLRLKGLTKPEKMYSVQPQSLYHSPNEITANLRTEVHTLSLKLSFVLFFFLFFLLTKRISALDSLRFR